MSLKTLRIATRNSPLALWQASHVGELLLKHWPDLEIKLVPMVTSGDKFLKNKLATTGGKGLFVKELEEALLKQQADIAVHSMKDVPAVFPDGLGIAAICKRHAPFDAFVSDKYACLNDLPQHATIGTTSLRRQSQLLAVRPDLKIKALRGNIQTRIAKLKAGEYDGIILAVAGLERMGMGEYIKEILTTEIMLPACGQGAIGIECHLENEQLKKYLIPLNDPISATCVHSERHVNKLLGGNCHVPLAVYCNLLEHSMLHIKAKVANADGKITISNSQQGALDDALILAEQCAQALLTSGAQSLLESTLS